MKKELLKKIKEKVESEKVTVKISTTYLKFEPGITTPFLQIDTSGKQVLMSGKDAKYVNDSFSRLKKAQDILRKYISQE